MEKYKNSVEGFTRKPQNERDSPIRNIQVKL